MKSRVLALLIVFVLILGLVPSAVAQDLDPCFGLSAEDCAIVDAASQQEVTSFYQSYDFSLTISGVPDSPDVSITSTGEGPFVIDPSMMTEDNPFGGLAMWLDMTGSISGTGEDISGPISIAIVDSILYIKDPQSEQWLGVSITDLVEQSGGMGALADPEALLGAAGGGDNPLAALGDFDPNAFFGLLTVPGFLTQTRLADESMMDQTMYPFVFTADFTTLFASQEFQTLLRSISESSTDPNMAQAAMVGAILPMLVQEGNISVSRWVGADDGFVHRFGLDLNVNVDVSAMGGDTSMEPIAIKMSLVVDMTEINNTAAPTAPEGATIVPASQLMGGM